MRVRVDQDLCAGHARCNAVGPNVYELDDRGYCALIELDVPPALEQQARDGASLCPEGAIGLTD